MLSKLTLKKLAIWGRLFTLKIHDFANIFILNNFFYMFLVSTQLEWNNIQNNDKYFKISLEILPYSRTQLESRHPRHTLQKGH